MNFQKDVSSHHVVNIAKEICHQECPAMMEHGENHLVRCWKYHERWNKEDVENGK